MPHDPVLIELTQESAKPMADRLLAFMRVANPDAKRRHAYEALARAAGYPDWNTLKARLPPAAAPRQSGRPVIGGGGNVAGSVPARRNLEDRAKDFPIQEEVAGLTPDLEPASTRARPDDGIFALPQFVLQGVNFGSARGHKVSMDKVLPRGNTVCVGATGSGKSTFCIMLGLAAHAAIGSTMTVIERKSSAMFPVLAAGGRYLDLKDSNSQKIDPAAPINGISLSNFDLRDDDHLASVMSLLRGLASRPTRTPHFVVLDEILHVLRSPDALSECVRLGRDMARKGGGLIWTVQAVEDIAGPAVGQHDLVDSLSAMYLMSNAYWSVRSEEALSTILGQDRGRSISDSIRKSKPRRNVVVSRGSEDILIEAEISTCGPAARIFDTSLAAARRALELQAEYGDAWMSRFIEASDKVR